MQGVQRPSGTGVCKCRSPCTPAPPLPCSSAHLPAGSAQPTQLLYQPRRNDMQWTGMGQSRSKVDLSACQVSGGDTGRTSFGLAVSFRNCWVPKGHTTGRPGRSRRRNQGSPFRGPPQANLGTRLQNTWPLGYQANLGYITVSHPDEVDWSQYFSTAIHYMSDPGRQNPEDGAGGKALLPIFVDDNSGLSWNAMND